MIVTPNLVITILISFNICPTFAYFVVVLAQEKKGIFSLLKIISQRNEYENRLTKF